MYKLLYLILLSMTALSVKAQGSLKGKVCDTSSQELPFSTVQLLSTDSALVKGTITDSLGVFSFAGIKPAQYIIKVSCTGYLSQYKDIRMTASENMLLPTFQLKADNILLDEVVVRGNNFIHQKDHFLIIPDKIQKDHAYSGYDLLYNLMIPGVDVDAGNGTVSTARGQVTLYINGIKANFREIQNLRPKDIEKVEYYDIPSGIYTGDIASINYVTREYKSGGYVALDGNQTIGYLSGKYNVGAKLDYNKWSYTFFGGYSMNKHDGIQEDKTERMEIARTPITRYQQSANASYRERQQYAQFKVNYKEEKFNCYGLVALVHKAVPENSQGKNLHYANGEYPDVASLDSVNEDNLKPSVCIDGVFRPTSRQRIHVWLDGSYAHNTYQRSYQENSQYSSTDVDENLYIFSVAGIYNLNFANSSLSTSLLHDHQITSSSYEGDYDSWQHLWRGETLLLVSYRLSLFDKKLTLMIDPGVSLLNYKLHSQERQEYWNFRTNSWIQYQITPNHQLVGGYSRGNYQPNISYLNTTDQTIDFLRIKRGNPLLANPFIQDYFFTYNAVINPVTLQINAGYTKITNNTTVDHYSEGDKLITGYQSNTTYDKWKVEGIASCRISDYLRLNGRLKYEKFKITGAQQLEKDNLYATLDVNCFINAFTINSWVRSAEHTLNSTQLAIAKSPWRYGFSVRYNKKQWMVEVGTSNPFSPHLHYDEYAYIGAYQYDQTKTSRIYQQTGYVKAAYTFEFGRKTSRDNNNVDRSINSAIMRVN